MANKEKLQEQAVALGIETKDLTVDQLKEAISKATPKEPSLEEQLEVAQAKVVELQEAIAKEAADARAKALEDELKNDKRPVFKHTKGTKYRFKKTAPESLNIDGVTKSIADVVKSKDIMTDLIEGNSNLIEQIHI